MAPPTPISRAGMGLNGPRSTAGSQATATPRTTAPVLDYACLFTHDLKRKQKRWQDGRLKFHTFNKRVMVYDERGNFVGDMHWTEDYDFDEGEEFQLERGCVIVQVSECLGSKDQDLSELVEKRYQDKEQRQARSAAASTAQRNAPPSFRAQVPNHRPLTDVTTTPRGNQLGRAVIPSESPYERRLQQNAAPEEETPRPTKRRKPDFSPPSKSGYAQSLFGATLSLSPWTSQASQLSQPSQPSHKETSHEAMSGRAPEYAAARPSISRPRAPPSLLQRVQRPMPLNEDGEQVVSSEVKPTKRKKKKHEREVSPPDDPEGNLSDDVAAERTVAQQPRKETSKHDRALNEASKTKLSSIAKPPTQRKRMQPFLDEDSDDVAEVKERPTPAPPRMHQSPPKSRKSAVSRSQVNPQRTRDKETPEPVPGPVEVPDQENANHSRLVSRSKSSRKRGLLMVSNRNSSKKSKHDTARSTASVDEVPTVTPATAHACADRAKERLPMPVEQQQETKTKTANAPLPIFVPSSPELAEPSAKSVQQHNSSPRRTDENAPPAMFETVPPIASPPISAEDHRLVAPLMDQGITSPRPVQQSPEPVPQASKEKIPREEAAVQQDPDPSQTTVSVNIGAEYLLSGARLASLGRRSIKSKEILCFPQDFESDNSRETPSFSVAEPSSPESAASDVLSQAPEAEEQPALGARDCPAQAARSQENVDADQSDGEPHSAQDVDQVLDRDAPAEREDHLHKLDVSALGSWVPPEEVHKAAKSNTDTMDVPSLPRKQRSMAKTGSLGSMVSGSRLDANKGTGSPTLARTQSETDAGANTTAVVDQPLAAGPRPARLVNPATRGRKAAQKSDAAGKMPQTVVPSLPLAELSAVPRRTQVGAPRPPPPAASRRAPALPTAAINVPEPVGEAATATMVANKLPGFSKAGGGAWSKTAFDLLGMERPSR